VFIGTVSANTFANVSPVNCARGDDSKHAHAVVGTYAPEPVTEGARQGPQRVGGVGRFDLFHVNWSGTFGVCLLRGNWLRPYWLR